MAINVARHIRKLVARRDRLTRETASKQRQLDVVLGQLAKIHAALPPDPTALDTTAHADVMMRLHRFAVVDALPALEAPELPASWHPFVRPEGDIA